MDEKKQPSEQDILAEIAGPLEQLAKLGRKDAEQAAGTAEAVAEAAETAAAETVQAVTEPAEAAVETAETAVETAEAAVETAEAAAVETAETAVETAESAAAEAAEAAAEPVEAAAEAAADALTEPLEELSPEAQLTYETMADKGPAEDLPIVELPVVDGAPLREPEKPKWSRRKIVLTVVGILAVLAALIALVTWGAKNRKNDAPSGSDTEEVGAEHSKVDMKEMAKYGAFTYTDDSLAEKYNAQIAATVGDNKLTNAMLQIFYWSTVYNDLNENADYLSFRGPDVMQPFSAQNYGETVTWEQHYLQTALDYYLQNVALADEATRQGVTVSQETQEMIDAIPSRLAAQASEAGFSDVNDYLAQSFGPFVTVEDYLNYYRMTSLAYTYAGQIQQGVTVTDEDVEDFFNRHAEEYAQQGIEKIDQNVVNVRHILVMPEQDQDSDGDGTPESSSDAAWADARDTADELYASWQQNPTEDNFADMASSASHDTGSTENGGLYEGIYPGQMVTEFNDWCFDPSRQPGDTAIVRTDYGYHIMYFSGVGDYVYWRRVAESDTQYEKFNKTIDDLFSNYDLKVDYKNLHLFDIVTRSIAQDAANAAAGSGDAETP